MEHRYLRIVSVVLLVLVTATPLHASSQENFELWTECRPVWLLVESVPSAGGVIGLSKESIATAVRSRLRGARLYAGNAEGGEMDLAWQSPQDMPPVLHTHVDVVSSNVVRGGGFYIEISLLKGLYDPLAEYFSPAATWTDSSIGLHSGDGSYIISWVTQLTDRFIDAYLRVNESACSRSPLDP